MNKQNLHKIIKDLIEVRGESGLKVSDEVLFVQAATYDRGESMDKSKSQQKKTLEGSSYTRNETFQSDGSNLAALRGTGIPLEKNNSADRQTQIPATRNQIEYLKKQGVKVVPDLTKQEAFIMIRNYKESLKRENL